MNDAPILASSRAAAATATTEGYVRDGGDWRIKRLVLTRLRVDKF